MGKRAMTIAHVPAGFQRVFVEISVAFQRDAGKRAIIERAFQFVNLRGVGRGEEQVVVEESARDGRTGFKVTVVRQDEVAAELLVAAIAPTPPVM